MRTITLKKMRKPTNIVPKNTVKGQQLFKMSSFDQDRRYLAWGRVLRRRSEDMTVDVRLNYGPELTHVAVRSNEWTGSNSTGFGERDLPPVDCLVLIVFPYGTVEDALVLCSAFALSGIHYQKQAENLLVSSKETERLVVKESGIEIVEDKETGDLTITLPDAAQLEIDIDGSKVRIDGTSIEMFAASESFVKGTTAKTEMDKDQALMNALQTAIAAWTPVSGDGGAALKAVLAAFLALPQATYSNILSTKIKGE